MKSPDNPPRPRVARPGKPGRVPRAIRNRLVLKSLVVPAFEEVACEPVGGRPTVEVLGEGSSVGVRGALGGGHLLHVGAEPVDAGRTRLRFSLLAGFFVGDVPLQAMLVGNLLDSTPFHVQADYMLGNCGQMKVGCDLVVRDDDEPLVRRTLAELLRLADDFGWFFPLRVPTRLGLSNVMDFEIPWEELPHGELDGFLDAGLQAPPAERTRHAGVARNGFRAVAGHPALAA